MLSNNPNQFSNPNQITNLIISTTRILSNVDFSDKERLQFLGSKIALISSLNSYNGFLSILDSIKVQFKAYISLCINYLYGFSAKLDKASTFLQEKGSGVYVEDYLMRISELSDKLSDFIQDLESSSVLLDPYNFDVHYFSSLSIASDMIFNSVIAQHNNVVSLINEADEAYLEEMILRNGEENTYLILKFLNGNTNPTNTNLTFSTQGGNSINYASHQFDPFEQDGFQQQHCNNPIIPLDELDE